MDEEQLAKLKALLAPQEDKKLTQGDYDLNNVRRGMLNPEQQILEDAQMKAYLPRQRLLPSDVPTALTPEETLQTEAAAKAAGQRYEQMIHPNHNYDPSNVIEQMKKEDRLQQLLPRATGILRKR